MIPLVSSCVSSLGHFVRWGFNVILPPRCPVQGTIVSRAGAISPEAWKNLTFITDPKCARCGMPFVVDTGEELQLSADLLCGVCLATPRPYDAARSVMVYDNGSKPMILAFKHGDAIHMHTTLAPLVCALGTGFLTPDSVVVPVPLHWTRLIKRRYNQAAVLAQEVAKLTCMTCWPDALIRTRSTPPQGHKNAKDRHENVAGAFDINPAYRSRLKDKPIILIDDVFTTGATLEECAKVLKSGGARTVHVLTLARVVKE